MSGAKATQKLTRACLDFDDFAILIGKSMVDQMIGFERAIQIVMESPRFPSRECGFDNRTCRCQHVTNHGELVGNLLSPQRFHLLHPVFDLEIRFAEGMVVAHDSHFVVHELAQTALDAG